MLEIIINSQLVLAVMADRKKKSTYKYYGKPTAKNRTGKISKHWRESIDRNIVTRILSNSEERPLPVPPLAEQM